MGSDNLSQQPLLVMTAGRAARIEMVPTAKSLDASLSCLAVAQASQQLQRFFQEPGLGGGQGSQG